MKRTGCHRIQQRRQQQKGAACQPDQRWPSEDSHQIERCHAVCPSAVVAVITSGAYQDGMLMDDVSRESMEASMEDTRSAVDNKHEARKTLCTCCSRNHHRSVEVSSHAGRECRLSRCSTARTSQPAHVKRQWTQRHLTKDAWDIRANRKAGSPLVQRLRHGFRFAAEKQIKVVLTSCKLYVSDQIF